MYCGKCGSPLDDNATQCPHCGAPVVRRQAPVQEIPVAEAAQEAAPVQEAPVEDVIYEEVPVQETPVLEVPLQEVPVRTVPEQEEPVAEIPVAEASVAEAPVAEAPVEEIPIDAATDDEASVEEIPAEEGPAAFQAYPVRQTTERLRLEPRDVFDVDPPRQSEEWIKRQNKRRKTNRVAVTLLVIAGLLVAGVGGFFLFQMIYQNTDSYRISRAEELLLADDIDGGLSAIEDVSGEQAEAVRDFAEILRKRDVFAASYQPTVLQPVDDPVKVSYDRLDLAFSAFDGSEYLPEKLQKTCDTAYQRLTEMEAVFVNISLDDLTTSQLGVLQFGERKRGAKFTMKDIENAISLTEPAIEKLQTDLMETQAYADVASSSDALAFQVMNELYQSVSTQLAQDKVDLAEYKKTLSATDEMQYDIVASNYRARVSNSLELLRTKDDAAKNAETVYRALCYAWMAYAFDIA